MFLIILPEIFELTNEFALEKGRKNFTVILIIIVFTNPAFLFMNLNAKV